MGTNSEFADIIFHSGEIITVNEQLPLAEALAVRGDKILAIGKFEDLQSHINDSTDIVNLQGKTLMPGLIEAHTHPIMTAIDHNYYVDLSGHEHDSPESVYTTLRQAVAKTPKGQMIKCVGFDPIMMTDLEVPTAAMLDSFTTEHPIVIYSQTVHHGFCNSLALQMAGITKDSPDPPGGCYNKDEDGNLTGKITGCDAARIMEKFVRKPTEEEGIELLRTQLDDYAGHGFTTVAALGLYPEFKDAVTHLERLTNCDESPIRMGVFTVHKALREDQHGNKPELILGTPGTDRFCRVGVKFFADGSPYTGTMATKEPYLESEFNAEVIGCPHRDWYGVLDNTHKELYDEMLPFHQDGCQLATHAHGDRAIEQVLNVYERLLLAHPRDDCRHRLEHCGLITEAQLRRAKSLGVTPSLFVDHIHFYGERLRDDIIGHTRAERFMPLRWARDTGHKWSLHSDSPCMPNGPFRVMKAAMTRMPKQGSDPADPIGTEQCVGRYDVIKAYTINGAWQIFHEDFVGSLEVGKFADLIVLDRSPLSTPVVELDQIQVLQVYSGGKLVIPR